MGMTIVSFGSDAVNAGGFCHPPKPIRIEDGDPVPSVLFPDEGSECMDSTLSFGIDVDKDEQYDETLGLTGLVCVTRSAPYVDDDGYWVIDTQMVSLEMSGYSQLVGKVNLYLDPDEPTVGMIRQSDEALEQGIDVSGDARAFSYFEVRFILETEEYGTSDPVGPIQITNWIGAVPPGQPNGDVPVGVEPPADIEPIDGELIDAEPFEGP